MNLLKRIFGITEYSGDYGVSIIRNLDEQMEMFKTMEAQIMADEIINRTLEGLPIDSSQKFQSLEQQRRFYADMDSTSNYIANIRKRKLLLD